MPVAAVTAAGRSIVRRGSAKTIFAISFGGKMAAIDERSGERVWQRDIGGSETPWVAGNQIFIITSNSEIVAMARDSGAIIWVSQLARYKDKDERAGHISWTGPILAGGRLMAFSADGRAAEINPADGVVTNTRPSRMVGAAREGAFSLARQ